MANMAAYLGIAPRHAYAPLITIEVHGLKEARSFLRNLEKLTPEAGANSVERIAWMYRDELKLAMPRWNGHLQETVNVEVQDPRNINVTVGAFYAGFVLNGTKPRGPNWHLPPKLKGWARSKGINEKALEKTIQREGTKPNDYVSRANIRAEPKIVRILEEELDKLMIKAGK